MKKLLALVLGLIVALGLAYALGERHYRGLEVREGLALARGAEAERLFVLKGRGLNEQGFRERELELDKPERMERVVVLGDSVTFGSGVRIHETWTRQAEMALRAERRLQFVNLAVYSYDLAQIVATLELEGWDWDPDLVLYAAYTNDHVPTDLLYMEGGPVYVGRNVAPELPMPGLGSLMVRNSAMARRLYGGWATRADPGIRQAEWKGDMSWYEEQLGELKAACEERGVPLLVYGLASHAIAGGCTEEEGHPCTGSKATALAMQHAALAQDIPFASAVPYLEASGREHFHLADSNAEQGYDWAHPNVEGHTLLAHGLVDTLRRQSAGQALAVVEDQIELPEDWATAVQIGPRHENKGRRPPKPD